MELNRYIDHTLLIPQAMEEAYDDLISAAIRHNFYAVCVAPNAVEYAVRALKGHPQTKVCSVASFPHGNVPLDWKLQQVTYLINRGAHEIDWVLSVGAVFSESWDAIQNEMRRIADICRSAGVVSKVIVESSTVSSERLLTILYGVATDAGVDFIKTSTGYNGPGAQLEHIALWNRLRGLQSSPKIKASGGIKTPEQAVALIEAGADRLGMSASVDIYEKWLKGQGEGNV